MTYFLTGLLTHQSLALLSASCTCCGLAYWIAIPGSMFHQVCKSHNGYLEILKVLKQSNLVHKVPFKGLVTSEVFSVSHWNAAQFNRERYTNPIL